MSRLIVKNLPKNITDEKIREIFSQKGTITDVQLKYTSEGKFRQFGFIGYRTENEADDAIKTYHQTFINTNKISVEKCALLGDPSKPKAWSKYSTESSKFKQSKANEPVEPETAKPEKNKKKSKKKDESVELLSQYKNDPMFEEFLQLHAPKEHDKLQQLDKTANNDDSAIESDEESDKDESKESDEEDVPEDSNKLAHSAISDLEYMKTLMTKTGADGEVERKPRQKTPKKIREKVDLFTVKLRDLPYNCKKKDIKLFFKPNTPYSIRIPRQVHGIAYVGFKNEKNMNKALTKDRSFMNGKRVNIVKFTYEHEEKPEEETTTDTRKLKWKNQEEALKNEEDIAESGKIFIRNLAYTTVESDIEELFTKYGPLSEVNLPIDTTTRKMKGFGVVTFLIPEHAVKAYSELDGSVLHGRMLHLLPGKSKESTKTEETIEESSNYKLKKAAKDKAQAGLSHNWNALFLGHDAVAEVIAETYGTTKEAVVGPLGSGSAAVRLALGETQIVAQTRKFLEQEGVVLDAFTTGTVKRSKTIILVKNLPSQTEARELRTLFAKHGEVGRVILPPSGITAIIEFLEPSEARKAFTRLAYSKFKNAPLYLEWAPDNSLQEGNIVRAAESTSKIETVVPEVKEIENKIEEEDDEEEPEPDTTLFVKNLNFKTTDAELRNHFKSCGKISYANVATKRDKSDANNTLSMGYGFVRFMYKASAEKALKTLQQSVLDGKSLELKRSERTTQNDVKPNRKTVKQSKQNGTKILVRNIPFQAKKSEVQELFTTFGEIKALRLPMKMNVGADSHRGFCFVDYATNADAKAAFEALSQSTHLYGRRLVLEWAAVDEGVDEIRKRTAAHFTQTEEVKSKKGVFNLE